MAVDDLRGFTVEVIPASDPSKRSAYSTVTFASGKQWRFHAWTWTNAAQGSLYLDDYREFNSGVSYSPDERMTFTYDALDRLVSALPQTTGGYTESYQYNAIGNMTYKSSLGSYTYPQAGQPRPHAATAAGSNSYTYDANGNMTRRVEMSGTQRITYTQAWDIENRLSVVTATNGVTQSVTRFFYDGDGKRVKKVDANSTTAYLSATEVVITGTGRLTTTSVVISPRRLDSPLKSDRGEFLRHPDGRLAWFHFGGRINRRA